MVAPAIIEQFIDAKMSLQLKKSMNQAHLEKGSYEQIVTHLETELELNSLEAHDELQTNSVTQKQQTENNKDNAGIINSDTNNSNPNRDKSDRTSVTVCSPCAICGNTNHPTEKCYKGAVAANRAHPWKSKPAGQNGPQLQDEQNNITESVQLEAQALNWICQVFIPELHMTDWRLLKS